MYCSNCGSKNYGNIYCTNCGNKLDNVNNKIKQNEENGLRITSIVLGVLGLFSCLNFVFGFIFSLVGLILGIYATKKGKNTLGIVLNSIGLFLSIIIFCLFIFLLRWVSEYDDNYNEDYYYNDYYEKF